MEFNDDKFIAEEFLKLKKDWDIKTAVETGTYQGQTSEWLANNFNFTHTIEIDISNKNNLEKIENKYSNTLKLHFGSSDIVLKDIIPKINTRTIFFLDAHWHSYWPLLAELDAIKMCNIPPIIAIHDFQCYDFGYDLYNGIPLNYEYVKRGIEKIYKEFGYIFYTNSPNKISGARRGVGYFIPK